MDERIRELECVIRYLSSQLRDAEKELAKIQEDVKIIIEWQKLGESIFKDERWNIIFYLGVWWADRPWRKRP